MAPCKKRLIKPPNASSDGCNKHTSLADDENRRDRPPGPSTAPDTGARPTEQPPDFPKDLIPTRHSLLSRLRDWEDHDSWHDFFEIYWRLIYATALKAGLSPTEAQDVVQETVIAVSKHMPSFKYDPKIGSFKGWLLKLTRWRIVDQFRRRRKDPVASGLSQIDPAKQDSLGELFDPTVSALETMWEQEWEHTLMDAALGRVKRRVDARQYQVFDLYVIKQWSVTKVSKTLKINVGQVYLAKHRVGSLIKKELAHLRDNPI